VHTDEVVSVHHRVDEPVQKNCEKNISIVLGVDVEPVEEEDCEVMVNVEERELSPFLTEHNKNSIPEVPNLRHIEQPKKIGHWRIITDIVIADERIIVSIRDHESFNSHVCTQKNLRDIINKLYGVGIH